jgi:hypothetical protein
LDEVISFARNHWRIGQWHLGLSCAKLALQLAQTEGNSDAEAFVDQMIDRYTSAENSFLFKRESAYVVFLKDEALKKGNNAVAISAERLAIADKLEDVLSHRPGTAELDSVMHNCGTGNQCFESGWGHLVRGDLRGALSCFRQCTKRSNQTKAQTRLVRSSDCSPPIGPMWRLYCAVCFTLHGQTETDTAKCVRIASKFDVWRFNDEWIHEELHRHDHGPSALIVPDEQKAECGAAQAVYLDGLLSQALVNFVAEGLASASQADASDQFWRRAQHILHQLAWKAIQVNQTSLLAAHAECGKPLRLVPSWFAALPRTIGAWRALGTGHDADITVVFFLASTEGVGVRCAGKPPWQPKRGAMLLAPRGATCELALADITKTDMVADAVAYMSSPSHTMVLGKEL